MKFIGIDLAWTYKNESGICVISDRGRVLELSSAHYSDDDLVDIIKKYGDDDLVIGIDAPLVVKNDTGSRPAEGAFMRHKIHGHHLSVFAVSRGYLMRTFKVIRGEVLTEKIVEALPRVSFRESLKKGQSTIFETFPSGICAGMFPHIYPIKYKIKGKVAYEVTWREMLRLLDAFDGLVDQGVVSGLDLQSERKDLSKKSHKHLEDMVDAFLCAYAGYSMYTGRAMSFTYGSIDEGMIMMPEIEWHKE